MNNMTIETLKKLIEIEFERTGTMSQFKHEVFRLIDLYESDKEQPTSILGYPGSTLTVPCSTPDEVLYVDVCPCNPKNGGSGICNCTIGNTMVINPNKYEYTTTTNFTTKI